ncbi:hypothetical protein Tdes44962_MAKER09361, partial [Teratosphaeria destructans]
TPSRIVQTESRLHHDTNHHSRPSLDGIAGLGTVWCEYSASPGPYPTGPAAKPYVVAMQEERAQQDLRRVLQSQRRLADLYDNEFCSIVKITPDPRLAPEEYCNCSE